MLTVNRLHNFSVPLRATLRHTCTGPGGMVGEGSGYCTSQQLYHCTHPSLLVPGLAGLATALLVCCQTGLAPVLLQACLYAFTPGLLSSNLVGDSSLQACLALVLLVTLHFRLACMSSLQACSYVFTSDLLGSWLLVLGWLFCSWLGIPGC